MKDYDRCINQHMNNNKCFHCQKPVSDEFEVLMNFGQWVVVRVHEECEKRHRGPQK